MEKYDVVYILKKNAKADELRISLRSVTQYLRYNKVWFYCGKPKGIEPDVYVKHQQTGGTKWERARSSMIEICKNDNITKKFWLFNDDFYLLAPVESEEPIYRGLLHDHIIGVERRHGGQVSGYTRQLRTCEATLKANGLTTLDYAVHIPMLIDRAQMLEALLMFPRVYSFRSLYGNVAQVGGVFKEDVKSVDPNEVIDTEAGFFSTSNKSFSGSVRKQLEDLFPDPCKYEEAKV